VEVDYWAFNCRCYAFEEIDNDKHNRRLNHSPVYLGCKMQSEVNGREGFGVASHCE